MPITFGCPCGKTLRVNDDLAGKRVKCPACAGAAAVPAAAPLFEVVEEEPPAPRPVATPAVRPAEFVDDEDEPRPSKAGRASSYDLEEEEERPAKRAVPKWKRQAADDGDDDRPRKKNKKRRRPAEAAGGVQWKVVGGSLLVLVLATAWLLLGLAADRIFFYPIILIGLAIIGMVRGFLGYGGDDDDE